MKIQVVYKNGQEDVVEPKFLDILLYLNEIQEFRRCDHWVNVHEGPLRATRPDKAPYFGEERRCHPPTPLKIPTLTENSVG